VRHLVDVILASPAWAAARDWGEPRPGHPEGTVGRHVTEQVLPFIEAHYRGLDDHWALVALAYLHDIGKPATVYRDGHLAGEPHSVLSARIAAELGAPDRLVQVILSNDRAYSHWRKLEHGRRGFDPARWTEARRSAFRGEFGRPGLDLPLLVRFHRADNGYRRADRLDEAVDPVFWFENRLVDQGLLAELPPEGRDARLDWLPKS
jgi:hypothetical protein